MGWLSSVVLPELQITVTEGMVHVKALHVGPDIDVSQGCSMLPHIKARLRKAGES